VRAALEAAERGETMALTAAETEQYLDTGELPERIERWAAGARRKTRWKNSTCWQAE
jgi:hypothetical protein